RSGRHDQCSRGNGRHYIINDLLQCLRAIGSCNRLARVVGEPLGGRKRLDLLRAKPVGSLRYAPFSTMRVGNNVVVESGRGGAAFVEKSIRLFLPLVPVPPEG